jgi:hypothetical protein
LVFDEPQADQTLLLREKSRELPGRVEIDDAHLVGKLAGGKSALDPENNVPFMAAVPTMETDHPLFVCFKLELANDAIAQWAKKSLRVS